MKHLPLETLNTIGQVIYDKKGFNILGLDVRDISNITDFIVIAEGNIDRHITAIANAIIATLEEKGVRPLRVEGLKNGDWVVVDYGDIMIHIFAPGLRERYALERLWNESKLINLDINVSADPAMGSDTL